MTLRIGDTAPDFEIDTTKGKIRFHDWAGDSWVFFFSHPADFTPVCTTEIGRTAQLAQQFADRNVKCLGLSTDAVDAHLKWINDVNDTQKTTVDFPMVADKDLKVSQLYGMLHPNESETQTVRSVYIIDPAKKIRLTLTYPMSVGRNFTEILRVIDSMQLAQKAGIATPADWTLGQRVIIPPSVTNEAAKEKFPQGWDEARPYLRYTTV